jgi:hypothetical protein
MKKTLLGTFAVGAMLLGLSGTGAAQTTMDSGDMGTTGMSGMSDQLPIITKSVDHNTRMRANVSGEWAAKWLERNPEHDDPTMIMEKSLKDTKLSKMDSDHGGKEKEGYGDKMRKMMDRMKSSEGRYGGNGNGGGNGDSLSIETEVELPQSLVNAGSSQQPARAAPADPRMAFPATEPMMTDSTRILDVTPSTMPTTVDTMTTSTCPSAANAGTMDLMPSTTTGGSMTTMPSSGVDTSMTADLTPTTTGPTTGMDTMPSTTALPPATTGPTTGMDTTATTLPADYGTGVAQQPSGSADMIEDGGDPSRRGTYTDRSQRTVQINDQGSTGSVQFTFEETTNKSARRVGRTNARRLGSVALTRAPTARVR